MQLAAFPIGKVLFGFGSLLGALLLLWGSLVHRQEVLPAAVVILATIGVMVVLAYALAVYRHGSDGGCWPLVAAIHGAAWALVPSTALGTYRLFGLRRRSVPGESQ